MILRVVIIGLKRKQNQDSMVEMEELNMNRDIDVLFERIESAIDGAFVVLEEDNDTVYVKSYETGEHYAIRITECKE